MDFLKEDNPVAMILARGMDLVLLNLCFVTGCIPVFTIGASLTALYDVSTRLILGEEPGIAGTFFRSFVKYLKRGAILFLLAAGAGAFLLLDFWSAARWNTPFRFASQVRLRFREDAAPSSWRNGSGAAWICSRNGRRTRRFAV